MDAAVPQVDATVGGFVGFLCPGLLLLFIFGLPIFSSHSAIVTIKIPNLIFFGFFGAVAFCILQLIFQHARRNDFPMLPPILIAIVPSKISPLHRRPPLPQEPQ